MIVVFGSINVDLIARVPRLPRAGETLSATGLVLAPGGKGANQALGAARAGGAVTFFGCVGKDGLAELALANLKSAAIDLRVASTETPTGIAMIHVDEHGENCITIAAGANADARADAIPDEMLASGFTIVMQNELPAAEVLALARRAHACGSRVIFNAAPAAGVPAELLRNVDVLIANEDEARTLVLSAHSSAAVERVCAHDCCKALIGPSRAVVVTRGADGVVYSTPGAEPREMRAPRIRVIDTVGAGDAFVAALAVALDHGGAFDEALREAIAAGALACMGAGAQTALPSREEIVRFVFTMTP